MTRPWAICFRAFEIAALLGAIAPRARPAEVSGRVELRDSHEPAVRQHGDYSGVVVSLRAAATPATQPLQPSHAVMTQKNKMFTPHVLAIPVGSTVDFPNLDP